MGKQISPREAVSFIKDDYTIMVGGFGLTGAPLTLIQELEVSDAKGLTIISNNLNGLSNALKKGKIKKAIGSYFTSYPEIGEYYIKGLLEVDLLPQGTLAESIRAGGAGIGGYFTKTSVGTKLAEGKEVREIDGETYVFEKALKANVAFIRASYADELGNLSYDKTAKNFNPIMATAADIVIAEVDQIVPRGQLNPELIATPHLYVDYIVESTVKLGVVR